ncbi:uncharacterized protein [Parasteatoda tepidariorum]|uniref:uncharacterized protein n=1 Tax=Parasteatoda tepidariorum TaxID=114398 RepID=UPI001C71F470|nr:uncharacterized protein LOC107437609 [Parasteatoda tepidariorum]
MNKFIVYFSLLFFSASLADECEDGYMKVYKKMQDMAKNKDDGAKCLEGCKMCTSIILDETAEAQAKMQQFMRDVKKMTPNEKRNIMDCMESFGRKAMDGMNLPPECVANMEASNLMVRSMMGI